MGAPGISDIVGFLKDSGRIVCVECKRPGLKATPAQQAFLDAVNQAGGLAFVATCVEDVVEAFRTRRP